MSPKYKEFITEAFSNLRDLSDSVKNLLDVLDSVLELDVRASRQITNLFSSRVDSEMIDMIRTATLDN